MKSPVAVHNIDESAPVTVIPVKEEYSYLIDACPIPGVIFVNFSKCYEGMDEPLEVVPTRVEIREPMKVVSTEVETPEPMKVVPTEVENPEVSEKSNTSVKSETIEQKLLDSPPSPLMGYIRWAEWIIGWWVLYSVLAR